MSNYGYGSAGFTEHNSDSGNHIEHKPAAYA
jgi:hypothetical protein